MFRVLRLILFTVAGILFFLYLFYGENNKLPSLSEDIYLYLFSIVASALSSLGVNFINTRLDRKLPWRRNITLRFVSGLLLNFAWVAGILMGLWWLSESAGIISFDLFNHDMAETQLELKLGVLIFLTLFITNLIAFNTYSYNEYSVGQIRKMRAERKQLEYQFEALKSQLSPHYLFNSMNTISSLIYRDAAITETFIRNLAETFNYVLQTKDVKLVPLKEEIAALKDFNYLLRIRYADAVDLVIELDEEVMDTPIPPLTLQLLVENAVKHNIVSDDEPLRIKVYHHGKQLMVHNNKTGAPTQTDSHQVGIKNIKKRYHFFTAENIQVVDNGHFEVALPILSAS